MQKLNMKTHLAHGIEKTEYEAQYDENVKVLLSDKQVLARIAKHRTEEFKDYELSEIMECIEEEPEISKVSLYPGKGKKEAIRSIILNQGQCFTAPGCFRNNWTENLQQIIMMD